MFRMSKKVFALLLCSIFLFSAIGSLSVFAHSGDITGGEQRFDQFGHTLTYVSETASTCTAAGCVTYFCETCNKEYYDYLALLDHTESDWITDVEPTTDTAGHKYKECTVCHEVIAEEDIPVLQPTHIPGDVNSDGAVNNKDLSRLFQYLSDWDVEVNEAALDINGDGSVNNKDLTRLFQYLSDWDVQIY